MLNRIDHGVRQLHSTGTTLRERLIHGEDHPSPLTVAAYSIDLFGCVERVLIESHHHRLSEAGEVDKVSIQVLQSFLQSFHVGFFDALLGDAAMHLQSLCRYHDHRQPGPQSTLAALDIEELLRPQVRPEARLGDHVVTVGHRHLGRQHRVAAMCNVGEGAAMHECGGVLRGLHQVGVNGILHQHGDGPCHPQILHSERIAVTLVSQQYVLYTSPQVSFILRQAEDGHQLRGGSDIEPRFCGYAVARTQSSHNITQAPVVHIQHPLP